MSGPDKYLIRLVTAEDDLLAYQKLYRHCECLINIGHERKDELLHRVGSSYAEKVFTEDLSSFTAMQSVFNGTFWVLEYTITKEIVGSVAMQLLSDGSSGELRRMCVSMEHRRKGLGLRLVSLLFL